MIAYHKEIEYNGKNEPVIETAKSFFMTHCFQITSSGENEIEVSGPGMNSTKQNPIMGVTKATISLTKSSISFDGELGGVEFMQRFVYFFPPALITFLAIIFSFTGQFDPKIFLAVVPWLIISPIMAKSIKKKTEYAIETLLSNLSQS